MMPEQMTFTLTQIEKFDESLKIISAKLNYLTQKSPSQKSMTPEEINDKIAYLQNKRRRYSKILQNRCNRLEKLIEKHIYEDPHLPYPNSYKTNATL